MKFAIVGYGVMGKLVEQCIHNRGEEIVEIIDSYAKGSHTWENAKRLKEAESAVCFTSPDAGYESVKKLLSSGINTIVGTTGFYIKNTLVDSAMMHEFDEIAKKNNSKMVYASNFCLSAHFFWKQINSVSSQMAEEGRIPVIIEVHHTRKKRCFRNSN